MNIRNKLGPFASATAGICAMLSAAPAAAIDFQTADNKWTFSVSGNVNVHYIYSSCESADKTKSVAGGLACSGSETGSSVSNVGNGLLPAAISFGVATNQMGYDIAGHFGLYPGIATNDGGSPNLQNNGGAGTNTALGTTGLDVRQVYLTFGNKDMGTFLFGRNFGLFGFDAIINDMTIPGVGAAGSASSPSPANTTLGSIGLGYIYVDTLAQMDYTTPDFGGFTATLGIYDPLNSLTEPNSQATTNPGGTLVTTTVASGSLPKTSPGFHGKLAYKHAFSDAIKLTLSSAFISQKQKYLTTTTTTTETVGPGGITVSSASGSVLTNYTGFGVDAFAMIDWQDLEAFAYYYHGSGLGTTGLFVFSDDGAGQKRSSNGYLLQATYKVLPKLKLGVNYGDSRLNLAAGETAPALVESNSKVTGGAYYSLTSNLTLLGEVTDVRAKAHDGDSNRSLNVNVGAFLSF